MEAKILQMTLVVTNQSKSLSFYTERVGFERKTDFSAPAGCRWVTVGPKGEEVELALWEVGSAVDPTQKEPSKLWAPGRTPPLVLRVADCQKVYQELIARGVEFLQPPTEHPWGIAATFQDPDGNLFSRSQPPSGWPKP